MYGERSKIFYRIVFGFMVFVMSVGYVLLLLQGTPAFSITSDRGSQATNDQIEKNRELLRDDDKSNDAEAYQALGSAYKTRAAGDPTDAEAADEADVRAQLRDLDKSVEAYRKAYELEPDNDEIAQGLAQAYADKGSAARAADIYEQQVRKNPANTDLLLAWADVSQRANRIDTAILAYEKYLKEVPDSPNREQIEDEIKRLKQGTPQQPQLQPQ